jgi:hypothetical protein
MTCYDPVLYTVITYMAINRIKKYLINERQFFNN